MKQKKYYWYLWLVLLVGWSCRPDPSCTGIEVPYVTAGIYLIDKAGNEAVQMIYPDSVWADGADALLYKMDTLTVFALPVNPGAASTSYHICLNDSCSSLILGYSRHEYLISPECGPGVKFDQLTASYEGYYDSVVINKKELTFLGEINVKIYK